MNNDHIHPNQRRQINIERITDKIDKAYSAIQLLEIRMKGQPFALRNARKQHEKIIKKNEAKLLLLKTSYAERVKSRNPKMTDWHEYMSSHMIAIRGTGKSGIHTLIGDSIMQSETGRGWFQTLGTNDINPAMNTVTTGKKLPSANYENLMQYIKPAMDREAQFNALVSIDFSFLENRVATQLLKGSDDGKKS